jgi:hypothetical protein
MAVWYSLWSFGIFFPFWYIWTKKNLATVLTAKGICNLAENYKTFKKLADKCFSTLAVYVVSAKPVSVLRGR